MVSSVHSQPALVLVVDADPVNQRAMRDKLLRLGFAARTADDHQSAVAIITATPPDVVLLPGYADLFEGWDELQAQLDSWGIPVLRLSPPSASSTTVLPEILDMGDADLKLRVDGALEQRNLYKALVIENARLAAERLHDTLTGLFNRRYMMIRTEEEIKRSSRRSYPLSCLLLDLDKFTDVNDKWGHAVGDTVLRDIAHIVTRTMRGSDVVSRYRDDEFLVLLTDTDATGAQVAANRLRDAVAAYNFYNPGEADPIKLTGSIGIAYWQPVAGPGGGTWEPQLIALAERALRAAKLSGPNRLVMLQAA
jgi:diguanylate cyclase (GGDEF)-like protein